MVYKNIISILLLGLLCTACKQPGGEENIAPDTNKAIETKPPADNLAAAGVNISTDKAGNKIVKIGDEITVGLNGGVKIGGNGGTVVDARGNVTVGGDGGIVIKKGEGVTVGGPNDTVVNNDGSLSVGGADGTVISADGNITVGGKNGIMIKNGKVYLQGEQVTP